MRFNKISLDLSSALPRLVFFQGIIYKITQSRQLAVNLSIAKIAPVNANNPPMVLKQSQKIHTLGDADSALHSIRLDNSAEDPADYGARIHAVDDTRYQSVRRTPWIGLGIGCGCWIGALLLEGLRDTFKQLGPSWYAVEVLVEEMLEMLGEYRCSRCSVVLSR